VSAVVVGRAERRAYALVASGSERGEVVLAELGAAEAESSDEAAAAAVSEECASQMGRELDTDGIKELLYRNMEHPRWMSSSAALPAELHAGLPDQPPTVEDTTGSPARRRSACVAGTPASPSIIPISTAARCARPSSPATASG
jgi:hypothetical protein